LLNSSYFNALINFLQHSMLTLVVQFVLGLIYANPGEWLAHKYILHALGKKTAEFLSFSLA